MLPMNRLVSMRSSRATLFRMVGAVAGGAGVAASSFLATATLLRTEGHVAFGLFAFSQVAIALGYGISNALLGAPLSVALNAPDKLAAAVIGSSFRFVNLLVCGIGGLLLALVMWRLGASSLEAVLYGVSGLAHWLRWFLRSQANAEHRHSAVMRSDGVYSIVSTLGIGTLWILSASIETVVSLLMIAAALGCAVIGKSSLSAGLGGGVEPFAQEFKRNGRHALVGVLSTELTANAHSYLVTLLLGPAAFAPLAAAQLLFRPIGVVIMSITQFERPRFSAMLQAGRVTDALRGGRVFSFVLGAGWLANALLAWFALELFMGYFTHAGYDPDGLVIAVVLSSLVMSLRCIRAPASALMQANGSFKPLSNATVISGLLSLPIVYGLICTTRVEWSIAGLVFAEVVCVLLILRAARRIFQADLVPSREVTVGQS